MIWRHNRIFFVDQLLSESVAHERHHDERAVEFEPEVFERVELIPEGEEAHDNFRDEEDPEDSLDDLAHDSIQALADDAVGEQPDLHTTVESMQRIDTGTSSTLQPKRQCWPLSRFVFSRFARFPEFQILRDVAFS